MSDFPIHDQVEKLKGENQTVGAFLEWLKSQGYMICEHHKHTVACHDSRGWNDCGYSDGDLQYANKTTEQLIADYFGIDLKAYRDEKEKAYQMVKRR